MSIIILFIHFLFLSNGYASDVFEGDEEKKNLLSNTCSHSLPVYESFLLDVSDSDEENLNPSSSSVQEVDDDGENCHSCCLRYYRAIPFLADITVTIVLGASSIIIPIITYVPMDESMRLTIGTIGSFVAVSGLIAKVYGWCVLESLK